MALAIDQESRPRDALLFAEALRNASQGLAPLSATAPTAHLGTSAATRVLPNRRSTDARATAATRVERRSAPPPRRRLDPVPAPAPSRQPASPAYAPRARAQTPRAAPRRSRGRGFRRLLAFLALALLFTAAVAIAVVLATSSSNQVAHLRTVVGHDAQHAIDSFRSLIDKNTK